MERRLRIGRSAGLAAALIVACLVSMNAHATTVGDEGPPAEASGIVAATVDTTHRTSVTTPAAPGSNPTNVPIPSPTNSGLDEPFARMQSDLATQAQLLDQAAIQNETRLVDLLATEMGITSRTLRSEQRAFSTSTRTATWGDLLVAHTLAANSDGNATVRSLMELHAQGQTWPAIVSTMGFTFDDVVGAIRQETQVATGMTKGDGKLVSLARGNAGTSTTIEKTKGGAKIIRGSGAEPAKTTEESGSK